MNGSERPPNRLRGRRILVAEDALLVAELIVQHLEEWGCVVVGPAARVRQALEMVANEAVDGALLDVNMGGETSFPIADVLAARGIPFLFVTGYGESGVPPEYRDIPRLNKPFDMQEMQRIVEGVLGAE